jgi:hypothetical protein
MLDVMSRVYVCTGVLFWQRELAYKHEKSGYLCRDLHDLF